MSNFLMSVDYDPVSGGYMACFRHGQVMLLSSDNYTDALSEANTLEPEDYEVGYN